MKYVMFFLLNIISYSIVCMYSETTDLSTMTISDLKSLQSISQELKEYASNSAMADQYTITPTCMASYIRHRENLQAIPTQEEIDFYEQAKNNQMERYQRLTQAVLVEVRTGKMGMIEHLHGALPFYAKKEEDRRNKLIAQFATTKKDIRCIAPTCIGLVVLACGIASGILAGVALTPPCYH